MDFDKRVAAAKRAIRSNSHDGIERRRVPFTGAQVRAKGAEGGYQIIGHAAVFDVLSEDLGAFEEWHERIEPGAFTDVLSRKPDTRALFNHDPNLVLARTKNGTLSLVEDAHGLAYLADVPAGLYYGDTLRILLERGDVDQSSFAFRVGSARWEEDDNGVLLRIIELISALYDVSPVTYPGYLTTDSGLASAPATHVEPLRTRHPNRERLRRRLEERELTLKNDAAPERKARASKLRREGWNDDAGAGQERTAQRDRRAKGFAKRIEETYGRTG